MSETILVTGFEPFGGIVGNPTMDIVAALHGGRVDGRQVVGRILPVVYDGHRERLKSLMDEVDPALVIGFGLDLNAENIRVETCAVNRAHFDIADNAGALLRDAEIHAGGPSYRISTFPADEICAALAMAGIAAEQSGDAGRYLCNATLFHLLELSAKKPAPALCGFIHVPPSTEQRAASQDDRLDTGRAMPLATMVQAARLILRETSAAARRDLAAARPEWRASAPLQMALR
ncbi:MAG TPA: pyroglutamyl-peptidase I [Terriglobia bacterium]|nr:pyroglutamyl-peptidase I [Terriglobia bacterium]